MCTRSPLDSDRFHLLRPPLQRNTPHRSETLAIVPHSSVCRSDPRFTTPLNAFLLQSIQAIEISKTMFTRVRRIPRTSKDKRYTATSAQRYPRLRREGCRTVSALNGKRRDDLPAVPVALVAPRAGVLALPPHPPPSPRVGDLHRLPVLALEQVTDLAEGGQGPPARLELARARHAVAAAVHPQQRAHHLRYTTETAVSTLVDMPPSNIQACLRRGPRPYSRVMSYAGSGRTENRCCSEVTSCKPEGRPTVYPLSGKLSMPPTNKVRRFLKPA